ncbi:MAG: hypothetical protein ABI249_05495 [Ornithinibacter sp.]
MLRLDSLRMITITAIVYAVLPAPSAVVVGWSRLIDPILHQVMPAVVGAHPYDVADVGARGHPAVAATLAGILVFGIIVAAVFWGIDAAIYRGARGSRPIGVDQPRGTST